MSRRDQHRSGSRALGIVLVRAREWHEGAHMDPSSSREIRFVNRPRGWPTADDFELVRSALPDLAEGQILVKNLYMSVDPYMRDHLGDLRFCVDPFHVGRPLDGLAVGEIVASRQAELREGDVVTSMRGWREYFVAGSADVRRVDRELQPLSCHLGVLGGAGLAAWIGLNLVGVQAQDRVFVSAAAGAVGSVAGQLAKLRGCFVVGSATTQRDVALLTGLGFDAAFNSNDGDILGQLNLVAPEGIDVYFDNLGGAHLEAALAAMRPHGRIIACAMTPPDNELPWRGPRNVSLVVSKRLTMKGYVASDSLDLLPRYLESARQDFQNGRLRMIESVVEGLEQAPQAFIDILREGRVGGQVVKLG
jgi:NADPH-dependent curcumin reductase CurA